MYKNPQGLPINLTLHGSTHRPTDGAGSTSDRSTPGGRIQSPHDGSVATLTTATRAFSHDAVAHVHRQRLRGFHDVAGGDLRRRKFQHRAGARQQFGTAHAQP